MISNSTIMTEVLAEGAAILIEAKHISYYKQHSFQKSIIYTGYFKHSHLALNVIHFNPLIFLI